MNDRNKHVPIEATLSHVDHHNGLKITEFYDNGKDPLGENKAIVATARTVLGAM